MICRRFNGDISRSNKVCAFLGFFLSHEYNVEYPVLHEEVVQEALHFVAVRHSGVLCV